MGLLLQGIQQSKLQRTQQMMSLALKIERPKPREYLRNKTSRSLMVRACF